MCEVFEKQSNNSRIKSLHWSKQLSYPSVSSFLLMIAGKCKSDEICVQSPSAAQTLAHSAWCLILQPERERACGSWPTGGTEGQSFIWEWKTTDGTDMCGRNARMWTRNSKGQIQVPIHYSKQWNECKRVLGSWKLHRAVLTSRDIQKKV